MGDLCPEGTIYTHEAYGNRLRQYPGERVLELNTLFLPVRSPQVENLGGTAQIDQISH